jgi:hypothetical protein
VSRPNREPGETPVAPCLPRHLSSGLRSLRCDPISNLRARRGRPSFNALQNCETATLIYYVFDEMILAGKDVMNEPLGVRR